MGLLNNRPTIAETFDDHWKLDPVTGCHVWQRACKGKEVKHGGGYGCLRVNGKLIGAHIFAWERINGPVPKGMQLLHSCHNTKCVNEKHLSPGTNAENQAEKAAALRASSRLSVADVLDIRAQAARGVSQKVIANQKGINQGDVSNIVRRKYWRHLAP